MLTKKNKGFTLIEMIIAISIFTICVAISLGIITYALAQKSANAKILSIQNNFSTVCATITDEIKGAYWPGYTGVATNAFLITPAEATISKELTFVVGQGGEAHRIKYYTETNAEGETRICKEEDLIISTTDAANYNLIAINPVTPYINQTISVNFVNSKGKITIVMVAKLKINGEENDISFVDTAYARNYIITP